MTFACLILFRLPRSRGLQLRRNLAKAPFFFGKASAVRITEKELTVLGNAADHEKMRAVCKGTAPDGEDNEVAVFNFLANHIKRPISLFTGKPERLRRFPHKSGISAAAGAPKAMADTPLTHFNGVNIRI